MATAERKKATRKASVKKRPASRSKGKTIVILSDGTGNSASALFKTNIWRLYRALDLSETPPRGKRRQIAYYDDGVGTSSFRPLALLGGAFGIGLKRNVLDLYRFICRNYEDGDEIYAFGFSRGAFTVRVAVGLLVAEGILKCDSEAELNRYSADAYRSLRRAFKQERWSSYLRLDGQDVDTDKSGVDGQSGRVVRFFRMVRDLVIAGIRRWFDQKPYEVAAAECRKQVDKIAFIGVFDTVAAYGMPVAELTRGIDEWIWPLSMPDYKLSPKVKAARHALALDDERDTFHPLVWDENEEQRLVDEKELPPGRMKQVWFSGMHADVGGGYPDDSVAKIPLLWMIDEARQVGLRFDDSLVEAIEREASPFAPLHDSRRGIGSYYRLQPRKLSARLDPPDPNTLIMQDPRLRNRGMLRSVVVHESVFARIERGTDKAVPIVLPTNFELMKNDGTIGKSPESSKAAALRAEQQEGIWNLLWQRRVAYFTTVVASLLMVALPLLAKQCLGGCGYQGRLGFVSTVIETIGRFLPNFLDRWIEYYAAHPLLFLLFVIILAGLMIASAGIHQSMRDDMRRIWAQSLGLPEAGSGGSLDPSSDPKDSVIYRLRTNGRYQAYLRWLKWKFVPSLFGIATLVVSAWLVFALLIRFAWPGVCSANAQILWEIGMCRLTQ